MKYTLSASLILLGAYWLYYASFMQMATTVSSVSDAMHLESELKSWMEGKRDEGRLVEADIIELFPEGYALVIGGENPEQNFRQLIESISKRNPLPRWPGPAALIIGILGLFASIRKSE